MAYKFKIDGLGNEEYYKMDDAAQLMGISRKAMRNRYKSGMVPTQRVGRRTFVPARFVEQVQKQGWPL